MRLTEAEAALLFPDLKPVPKTKGAKKPRKASPGEEGLEMQLRAERITGWVREFRFHPVRKWRFDFCFKGLMLGIEVEGGSWVSGAHSRGTHFEEDCVKYAEAALLGYRVIRVTTKMVKDGRALDYIQRILRTTNQGW